MEKTPRPQATTTMNNITFDGMPVALASLHEKCDTIIALLSTIASGSSGAAMHTPIGMTEASKLLGKSPSTIYEMTSKRKMRATVHIPVFRALYLWKSTAFSFVATPLCMPW